MITSRPLLLWLAPWYPPDHGRGAERTAHAFNQFLMATRGVQVIVASSNLASGQFEDVEIRNVFDSAGLRALIDQARVVCAQLDHIPLAAGLASACRKPIIYFVHFSTRFPSPYRPENPAPQYMVYNAEWVRQQLAFPMTSIVARPSVDWRHYRVETNRECITLISVEQDKGRELFLRCAQHMPDRRFLGSMDPRSSVPESSGLPNVEYIPFARDVREIYAKTRVLLMPSLYESWGRAAVEAMASGIPVVAHPTPGLLESLGSAGIFCDRDRIEDWIAAIERLDDPNVYQTASDACWHRAQELDPADALERVGKLVDACLEY